MNNTLILANGSWDRIDFPEKILDEVDCTIAVDGGFAKSEKHDLEFDVDIIVGDYDSLDRDRYELEDIEVKTYSEEIEGNETDLETALKEAEEMGAEKVTMVGVVGDRLDQSLSNIFLLERLADLGIKGEIITSNQRAYSVFPGESLEIETEKGNLISLIPLTEEAFGITTHGLKYSLKKGKLERKGTRGISNLAESSKVRIDLDKGVLLVSDEGKGD